jgi:aryl-alcohol dehydrogenase-like predicted oxidoreductase
VSWAAQHRTQANLRRLAPLLEQLGAIAARHGAIPVAVGLAWAISHEPSPSSS